LVGKSAHEYSRKKCFTRLSTLTEKILELNHAYLVIIFTGISTQLLTSFTVDINLLFFFSESLNPLIFSGQLGAGKYTRALANEIRYPA
jgi:hypothetical protein